MINEDQIKIINEFKKRWNILDSDHNVEISKFKNRILNNFKDIDNFINITSIKDYCNIIGITMVLPSFSYQKNGKNIIKSLMDEKNELNFYLKLQTITTLNFYNDNHKEDYRNKLKEAIDLSNINLTYGEKNGNLILYPKGEKLLDEKLVNEVLKFLDKKSNDHFEEALKFYQKGGKYYIKSAESLRRSLEQFLKYKLNTNSGLKASILKLQNILRDDKVDSQIRKIITQTFNYLDQYYNENSKHEDGEINEAENEFLIYQTGVLMLYINNIL